MVIRDSTIADGALLSTSQLIYTPNGSKVEILPDLELDPNGLVGVEPDGKAGQDKEVQ